MLGSNSESEKMERFQSSGPSATLSSEGELPCILVYSSYAHVKHLKYILDIVREYLENNGFRIVLLKDVASDLSIYSEEFLRAAKDCVLGVVILDGFRPNVLFEFGVLIGLEKPVILLKDKNAEINIKTLYGDVNDQNCKIVTGLTYQKFESLRNPLIKSDSSIQFSDLLNVSEYDHEASKSEQEHIFNLLGSNISKIRAEIEKEGEKLQRKKIPASMSNSYVKKYQEYVEKLYSLPLSPSLKEKDVDDIYADFKNLEIESNIIMPSGIYSLIASLYKSTVERSDKNGN
jgi:nucleoside 2-deoxyribosyltransferase